MNEFWSTCLNRFEQELPAQQFSTWIKGLRLECDPNEKTRFQLVAPNRFIMQWVRERYLSKIEALGHEYFSAPIHIQLTVDEIAAIPAQSADVDEFPKAEKISAAAKIKTHDSGYTKTHLTADFTFDTLVTGRANDLARAAAQQVAMNPGGAYNPLFIYGGWAWAKPT